MWRASTCTTSTESLFTTCRERLSWWLSTAARVKSSTCSGRSVLMIFASLQLGRKRSIFGTQPMWRRSYASKVHFKRLKWQICFALYSMRRAGPTQVARMAWYRYGIVNAKWQRQLRRTLRKSLLWQLVAASSLLGLRIKRFQSLRLRAVVISSLRKWSICRQSQHWRVFL